MKLFHVTGYSFCSTQEVIVLAENEEHARKLADAYGGISELKEIKELDQDSPGVLLFTQDVS